MDCTFDHSKHVVEEAWKAKGQGKLSDDKGKGGGKGKGKDQGKSPSKGKVPYASWVEWAKTQPCKSGDRCTFGERCYFKHDKPNATATASAVENDANGGVAVPFSIVIAVPGVEDLHGGEHHSPHGLSSQPKDPNCDDYIQSRMVEQPARKHP